MPSEQLDRPPLDPGALARWFAEGVRSELAALEKEGGAQSYEVLSGKLVEATGPTQAIFHFIIADATRVPEDASGRVKTASDEYAASVIGQEANRIHLQLEGKSPPPLAIPRATLIIDDTALLRRLAEILEEAAGKPAGIGPLATTVFHPAQAIVGIARPRNPPAVAPALGEVRRVIEHVCGSSLTYLWGPPGTGKTVTIARLVATLVDQGERVLVTSHTHAAVDQALYAAVSSRADPPGPLADHLAVQEGKVLRVGPSGDRRVPDSVRLDKVMEVKARELESAILELEGKAKPLADVRTRYRAGLAEWSELAELTRGLQEAHNVVREREAKGRQGRAEVLNRRRLVKQRQTELEEAQRAWFRRVAKTERAVRALREAEDALRIAEGGLASLGQQIEEARTAAIRVEAALEEQRLVCQGLLTWELLETNLAKVTAELEKLEGQIRALQEQVSRMEQELIAGARVICCTLTKNYMGKELGDQRFDAVIVDEISIALPPLLFLAANRATTRVVLVGDFLQLPPIVRSDHEISNARLGTDAFHLAGVARDMKPVEGCAVLKRLTVQQRMLPAIADVARHLVYTRAGGLDDHPSVLSRQPRAWLDYLPKNPLLIVDTADLHCWSGKQPGSLSRFNFYSATVAVELAAMAAANILPQPGEDSPPPIGIVTPFSAQRRLLSRLVTDLGLGPWVAAGTVHTFQGSQAELIIFDSVLDAPYWSARHTHPRDADEVKRELNVAVTRARSKFVLVGSSEWLNKHAKSASGLGQLWAFLKVRADLVSAVDLVERAFSERVAGHARAPDGWRVPSEGNGEVHEIFDETTFFERFASDIASAARSIFGLVPYFGEYRWPRIQPLVAAALARGVEVTLVTPPLAEAENRAYVEEAIKNLRSQGAVVISAAGLHGKDIVIDERIHYTGSLNWASHRGRSEIMHRTASSGLAKLVLHFMQAKYIRAAAVHEDGTPRSCPHCGGPTQVVNQRRQHGQWDFQAMKVGCASPECHDYLRNIDERPPFRESPRCRVDGRTRYRRIRRGKGEVWQCPKHPKECPSEKVVPGDPE